MSQLGRETAKQRRPLLSLWQTPGGGDLDQSLTGISLAKNIGFLQQEILDFFSKDIGFLKLNQLDV